MIALVRSLFIAVCCVVIIGTSVAHAAALHQIKVISDRAPDCSSLKSIVDDVTRGCKTDDERVIAIYNFCRFAYYHHAYPRESGGISTLKLINVYGWGLCGGQHTVMASLWEAAGYKWRYRGWNGHTTIEVYYGGRWHYLDTFLKYYTWMPDPGSPGGRTIAGQEDIRANNDPFRKAMVFDSDRKVWYRKDNRFTRIGEEINSAAPAFLVCGDSHEGVFSGIDTSRNSGSPRGWGGIRFDGPDYSTDVDLAPGYALTLDWKTCDDAWYFEGSKQSPRHTCGDKDFRNCPVIGPILEPYRALNPARTWSNGTLVFRPEMRDASILESFHLVENVACRAGLLVPKEAGRPGVLVVRMASPYVVARASAKLTCDDARLEVSTDDDSTFKPVEPGDLTKLVAGAYRYDVRITFSSPLSDLELTSIVQHNQESLPYLAPGMNRITISAANPETLGRNRLVVTYAYCTGHREATVEQVYQRGAELARAHYAQWSEQPIVVQKIVDRLPCTIDIPIATPKGKQAVYPRMVFLRREILAPGQSPMPLPVVPSIPRVGPGEQLITTPDPWTLGITPPSALPQRPVDTVVRAPTAVSYVSKQGEVYAHQFVKWLKDDSDAWVLLARFDSAKLPQSKDFSSARLVFHVEESHNKAPMQVGVAPLSAPFEAGRPFDLTKLGKVVGTTIVASGNGPGDPFIPARRYEIDISEQVRRWIKGERPTAVALHIIPNRAVDDGWTVRFTPEKQRPIQMEISTFKN